MARTEENATAAKIQLAPEDLRAIRELAESADIRGGRVPPQAVPKMDCVSLDEWKGE